MVVTALLGGKFWLFLQYQWQIEDRAFGANAPPLFPSHLVEELGILLIKTVNFISGQDQFYAHFTSIITNSRKTSELQL